MRKSFIFDLRRRQLLKEIGPRILRLGDGSTTADAAARPPFGPPVPFISCPEKMGELLF